MSQVPHSQKSKRRPAALQICADRKEDENNTDSEPTSAQNMNFGNRLNERRKKGGLSIQLTKEKYSSFKYSDTSYTKGGVTINHQGLQRTPQQVWDEIDKPESAHEEQEYNSSFIKHIDEIRYLEVLGRGQSGLVRQAVHIPTKTFMAVKQISIYEKSMRHQIMNELNALYDTKSNGLVEFYDMFYKGGSVYIALEYCDCGSLADVLTKVKFIPEIVLGKFTVNILEGLICLHQSRKQVHRDIKPHNICLCSSGEAKVADFGISADLKDSLAKCRTVVGTLSYMSPERFGDEYSFGSDIWALGIMLIECATGKPAYPQTSIPLELMQFIVNEEPPSLPKDFKCSPEFRDFVTLCLKKEPKNRATATQLSQHKWIKNCADSQTVDLRKWIADSEIANPLPDINTILQMKPNDFDEFLQI